MRGVSWLKSLKRRLSLKSLIGLVRTQKGAVLVAVLGVGLFIIAGGLWEYAGSNAFCGTVCHVNFSAFESSRESPHDRVKCVECHLGRGLLATELPRKASYAGHAIKYILRDFETPIYVKGMRPARETCEECHWPLAFHDDSVREERHFAQDEENAENITYLVMHTGGGTAREGRGKGIHWHVENQVWYVATDPLKQNIPWVRAIDQEGTVTDYVDVSARPDPEVAEEGRMRRMDCIDCHNRTAHLFPSPKRALDEALAVHQISEGIPFIKAKGVEVLTGSYGSTEEGLEAIEGLEEFYRTSYPDYYDGHSEEVKQAIQVLQAILVRTAFPELDVTWATYPNSNGHDEFPGCFRCHDGKHISEQGESIRLHCNICHSIPLTVKAGDRPPYVPLSPIPEPASHIATDWMARHRFEANSGCEDCHGLHEFGSDDGNFCSNNSCHGRAWEWVGLDAAFTHPMELVGRHADLTCNQCHAEATKPETECVACHEQHPHDWGSQECELCHSPLGWIESTVGAVGAPVPHVLDGREECVTCHDLDRPLTFPDDHAGRASDLCGACHAAAGNP